MAGYLANAYESFIEGNELGADSHRMSLMLERGMKSLACSECETQLTGSREDRFKCLKLKCGHFLHRVRNYERVRLAWKGFSREKTINVQCVNE